MDRAAQRIDLDMDFLAVRLVRFDLPRAVVELDLGDRPIAFVLDDLEDFGERLRSGWGQFIREPAGSGGAGGTCHPDDDEHCSDKSHEHLQSGSTAPRAAPRSDLAPLGLRQVYPLAARPARIGGPTSAGEKP